MPFFQIPASQVAQKAKKNPPKIKGRSVGSSPSQKVAQQKGTVSGASKVTVNVAAYGGKLFEPIMAVEKPIFVHFKDFIIRDEDAITRFSEDGWFAIKFFLEKNEEEKSRCYLVYFLNPINASKDYTLMQACKEAIEYKVYEFYDTTEYADAVRLVRTTGRLSDLPEHNLYKLRALSALGQVEEMIITILREKITAEKFLKRQREYEKQNQLWQLELEKQLEEVEEDEEQEVGEDAELEAGNNEASSESYISKDKLIQVQAKEVEEVPSEEGQEISRDEVSSTEIEQRDKTEVKTQSSKVFIWGGKK